MDGTFTTAVLSVKSSVPCDTLSVSTMVRKRLSEKPFMNQTSQKGMKETLR